MLWRICCAGPLFLAATGGAQALLCSVNMQNVAFGNIDVTSGAAVDATATLQVTCSGLLLGQARVCLSIDVGSAGDASSRQLQGPAGTLRYDLYSDAARTNIWGSWLSGYQGAGLQIALGNGTHNIPVYARLFGSQPSAEVGSYVSTFASSPFMRYSIISGLAPDCPTSSILTQTESFNVTATVLPACTISASDMDFGATGFISGNLDAASVLTVRCASNAAYSVSLGNGNTGTGPTSRKMVSGAAASVTYGLYRDPARTLPWGSTIGTDTVSGTGTGADQALTAYGRVPPQATPAPGTYTDTVVVTVTF